MILAWIYISVKIMKLQLSVGWGAQHQTGWNWLGVQTPLLILRPSSHIFSWGRTLGTKLNYHGSMFTCLAPFWRWSCIKTTIAVFLLILMHPCTPNCSVNCRSIHPLLINYLHIRKHQIIVQRNLPVVHAYKTSFVGQCIQVVCRQRLFVVGTGFKHQDTFHHHYLP